MNKTYPTSGVGLTDLGISTIAHQFFAHPSCVALGHVVDAELLSRLDITDRKEHDTWNKARFTVEIHLSNN